MQVKEVLVVFDTIHVPLRRRKELCFTKDCKLKNKKPRSVSLLLPSSSCFVYWLFRWRWWASLTFRLSGREVLFGVLARVLERVLAGVSLVFHSWRVKNTRSLKALWSHGEEHCRASRPSLPLLLLLSSQREYYSEPWIWRARRPTRKDAKSQESV